MSGSTATTITVTFDEPMENTNYSVILSRAFGGANWGSVVANVGNKTKDGFDINVWTTGSTESIPSFDWVAIPYMDSSSGSSTGTSSNMHNYSTEEKVVGTWVNGKPLYEKTFKTTVNATGSTEYFSDVIVEDAESYFIEQAYCTENENGTGPIQLIGSVNASGTYDYNITSFNLNTGRWWIIRGSGTYPYTTIIVRYTKTTDTATT